MMRLGGTIAAAAMLGTSWAAAEEIASGFGANVDATGAITVPTVDYRAKWTMLGAWAVDGDEGAEGFHIVYTQSGVAEAYRETGAWPDGAVVLKELRAAVTDDYTTGAVSRAAELQGMFVMVKDAVGRFEDNPLWGDGWGWAYFDGPGKETTTMSYADECLDCHVPAKETDWTYSEAYPVLRE